MCGLTFKLTGGPRRCAIGRSRVPARPVERNVRPQFVLPLSLYKVEGCALSTLVPKAKPNARKPIQAAKLEAHRIRFESTRQHALNHELTEPTAVFAYLLKLIDIVQFKLGRELDLVKRDCV